MSNTVKEEDFSTWKQTKREIKSMTTEEKELISQLAKLTNQLVSRRSEMGKTQREVAIKAGLTQSQVARIENNYTIPKLSTLLKMAKALDLEAKFY